MCEPVASSGSAESSRKQKPRGGDTTVWLAGWLICYQVKDVLHKWPSHVERRVNENDSLVEADLSKKIKPLICEQTVGERLRQLLASTVFFTPRRPRRQCDPLSSYSCAIRGKTGEGGRHLGLFIFQAGENNNYQDMHKEKSHRDTCSRFSFSFHMHKYNCT